MSDTAQTTDPLAAQVLSLKEEIASLRSRLARAEAACGCAEAAAERATPTPERTPDDQFRSIFKHASVGIATVSPEGRWLSANPRLCEILGYELDELTRKTFQDITYRVDLESDLELVGRVLSGEISSYRLDKRYLHKNGHLVWANLTVSLVRDAEGKPLHFISVIEDITQRHLMEEALREERERFTRIVDTSPGVICSFRLRPDGTACFPFASAGIETIYGFRPEALARDASPVFDRIHPDDVAAVLQSIEDSARTMTRWTAEFRVRAPNLEEIWVEGRSMPVREEDGSIIWHGVVSNTTDRKRSERELFEVNQRLQALMRALPVGVSFSDDASCQHITGNPAVLAQFEATPADNLSASAVDAAATGRQLAFFHAGQPVTDAELPLQRAVAENREIPPVEFEVLLPSGRRWNLECSGAPVRDRAGRVIGGVAVTVDITERRRFERAVRESEHFLRRMIDVAPGIIHVFDVKELRSVFINRAVTALLGRSPEQVQALGSVGTPPLMHPDDLPGFQRHIERLQQMRDAETAEFEHRLRDQTGAWRWFQSRDAVFLRDADGSVRQMIGSSTDVTAQREASDALARAKLVAEAASASKDRFIAVLSHELRTPLTPSAR